MDYQKELKRLEENEASLGSEYWKPKAGQYRVKSIGEIEDADPYEEVNKDPQPRKQLLIVVNGKEHIWNFPFGKTKASISGQLTHLATVKGNTLMNVEFTVVVVGEGQNIRFTIVL